MSLYPMYPADILNIRFRPSEQQVRKCLQWIFEDNNIPYGEECWLTKDKEDFIEGVDLFAGAATFLGEVREGKISYFI